jgi:hypothetical protein
VLWSSYLDVSIDGTHLVERPGLMYSQLLGVGSWGLLSHLLMFILVASYSASGGDAESNRLLLLSSGVVQFSMSLLLYARTHLRQKKKFRRKFCTCY